MGTIRELTARLGFEADLTGATRFDAAMRKSKQAESLNTVSLVGFRNAIGKAFAFVAAVGSTIVPALKFADLQQAVKKLKFDFQGSFKPLEGEINSILKNDLLGKLIKKLDLYNVANQAFEQGLSPEFLVRNFKAIATIATLRGEAVSQFEAAISDFIATGSNLDVLTKLGIFDQERAELYKASGVDPGKAGIIARKALIEERLGEMLPRATKALQEGVDQGLFVQKQFSKALNDLTFQLGERTLPVVKDLNDELIKLLKDITRYLKGEVSVKDIFFPTPEKGSAREKKIAEFSKEADKFVKDWNDFFNKGLGVNKVVDFWEQQFNDLKASLRLGQDNQATPIIPIPGVPRQPRPDPEPTPGNGAYIVNITNNIDVQSGATADANAIGAEIEKANRRSWGDVSELNQRTTKRRGGELNGFF